MFNFLALFSSHFENKVERRMSMKHVLSGLCCSIVHFGKAELRSCYFLSISLSVYLLICLSIYISVLFRPFLPPSLSGLPLTHFHYNLCFWMSFPLIWKPRQGGREREKQGRKGSIGGRGKVGRLW